jgi:hypothetical protein
MHMYIQVYDMGARVTGVNRQSHGKMGGAEKHPLILLTFRIAGSKALR